jgi:hypothetical protein
MGKVVKRGIRDEERERERETPKQKLKQKIATYTYVTQKKGNVIDEMFIR